MSDADVKHICYWCDANGVRLIMDEIYHGLTFDTRPTSALLHSNSAIVVNSFSKYFCMTGWRLTSQTRGLVEVANDTDRRDTAGGAGGKTARHKHAKLIVFD